MDCTFTVKDEKMRGNYEERKIQRKRGCPENVTLGNPIISITIKPTNYGGLLVLTWQTT